VVGGPNSATVALRIISVLLGLEPIHHSLALLTFGRVSDTETLSDIGRSSAQRWTWVQNPWPNPTRPYTQFQWPNRTRLNKKLARLHRISIYGRVFFRQTSGTHFLHRQKQTLTKSQSVFLSVHMAAYIQLLVTQSPVDDFHFHHSYDKDCDCLLTRAPVKYIFLHFWHFSRTY